MYEVKYGFCSKCFWRGTVLHPGLRQIKFVNSASRFLTQIAAIIFKVYRKYNNDWNWILMCNERILKKMFRFSVKNTFRFIYIHALKKKKLYFTASDIFDHFLGKRIFAYSIFKALTTVVSMFRNHFPCT